MKLNVIKGNRSERTPLLMKELETQGITDYEFWRGIYIPSVKASINAAHKQIVEYAQLADFDEVCIGEDDLKFSTVGAWDYFLSQKPKDFDIYLGGIFLGDPDKNGVVKDFTGLTLYVVAKRFYETFLAVDPEEHLDRALVGLGKFVVCQPFVVTQWDGFSANTGKDETYRDLQRNRTFW